MTTSSIIRPGGKRPTNTKGASVVVETFAKSSENVVQLGRKMRLPPTVLGHKALSAGHGLDIRLGELNFANSKPIWVERFTTNPPTCKVWVKQDIPATVPAPIVMSIGINDGPGDLGGAAKARSTGTNDDVHKTVVTDVSIQRTNVQTTIHGEGSDARRTTLYEHSHRLAYTPDGVLHNAYTKLNGAVQNAYHSYSSDGGRSWTEERVDGSWSGRQSGCCFAVNKYGVIFFAWAENDDADVTRRYIKIRTRTMSGIFGAIEQVSDTNADDPFNLDPCVQFKPDGVTLGITWTGQGYGSGVSDTNILYRTRSEAGTYSAQELLTTDAQYGVIDYRRPTLDYDSNSKPHICYCDFTGKNTYYTNKVGAGWLSPEQVNTDHNNAGFINSNILVDLLNNVHVCYLYLYDAAPLYNLIYKKRAPAGTWSAAATIENKAYVSQMQMNVNGDLLFCIPTKNYTTQYALVTKTLPRGGTLSAATIRDDRTALGYRILSGITLWGRAVVGGIYSNMPRQGALFLYTVFPAANLDPCDLVFASTSDAVMGDSATPIITQSFVIRRRGYISCEKKELIGSPLIK